MLWLCIQEYRAARLDDKPVFGQEEQQREPPAVGCPSVCPPIVAFVNPFATGTKPSLAKERQGRIAPGTVLWKAGSNANDFEFGPLDDVVMGGASASTFDKATGKWTGSVTDANNGGFVGIRSTPLVEYDLSDCKGIEWTLAGTDRDIRLKVVLRDSTDFNGIGWTVSRDTTGRKQPMVTLKIPFEGTNGLVPSRFAKILTDSPPFSASTLKAFQLTYSKFEFDGGMNPNFYLGDFSVQLLEIRTF